MKIFSGISNKKLAEKIAKLLGTTPSPLEIFIFLDGEKRIRIIDRVVDEDCVIVQPTSTPADTNYMELFFIADGLKRSGARSITAVVPYLGYQRQDHVFRDGEAVSLEVIVRTMEAVGIDRVLALDLHSIRIPEVFKIPVSHLSALPLFAEEIKKNNWNDDNSVLISPDMGGIRRIKILSELLGGMKFATVEKNRDLVTGKVEAVKVEGEIAKRAIIVDDMITTGNTMIKAADLLMKNGAEEVYIFATHPVFSSEAPDILQRSSIKEVYVTDSVFVSKVKEFPKLKVVTISEMVSAELKGLALK